MERLLLEIWSMETKLRKLIPLLLILMLSSTEFRTNQYFTPLMSFGSNVEMLDKKIRSITRPGTDDALGHGGTKYLSGAPTYSWDQHLATSHNRLPLIDID